MQNTRIKMRNKHKNKRRKRRGMTKKWKSKSLGYRYALPEASLLESTSRRRGHRKGRVKQGGGSGGDTLPPTQLCRDLRSLWQVLSVVGLHILPPNEFSAKYLCACCCCCCCGSNKSSSSSNSQWSGI